MLAHRFDASTCSSRIVPDEMLANHKTRDAAVGRKCNVRHGNTGEPSEASSTMGSRYRQEQVPSSLLYFKSEPSGEGWPTRAGERPAPWTLPQNLIDEARALADGRIPLPEPERVPWDVLIAQAVNWDIPERLAA